MNGMKCTQNIDSRLLCVSNIEQHTLRLSETVYLLIVSSVEGIKLTAGCVRFDGNKSHSDKFKSGIHRLLNSNLPVSQPTANTTPVIKSAPGEKWPEATNV